jgi:hypothetical protein
MGTGRGKQVNVGCLKALQNETESPYILAYGEKGLLLKYAV